MPRAIWSGSISFGLVNIPIKLFNAVSRKIVHFNQIDTRTEARGSSRSGCRRPTAPRCRHEAIAKGYELAVGRVRPRRATRSSAALDPKATRTIDIEEFVDLADIDPVFYDAAYLVAPDKATVKPYALLLRAMEESGKVGIARFVMRTKQYLAAIRPGRRPARCCRRWSTPTSSTRPSEIPELDAVDDVEVSDKELAMAQQLIESPRRRVRARAVPRHLPRAGARADRAQGGGRHRDRRAAPAAPAADKVVDLMAALEASVAAAKEARKRHPSAGGADEEADEAERRGRPKARPSADGQEGDQPGAGQEGGEAPAKKVAARKSA